MYVCYCSGVTEDAVTDAIEAGAHTTEELADFCDAGTGCGGCHPTLVALLAEHAHRLVGAG